MKTMNILGKNWIVSAELVENDILVTAVSGDKTFCEWVDVDLIVLELIDHAYGCENLTEDEEDTIRRAINEELKKVAIELGYTPGYVSPANGIPDYYSGVIEDTSYDDENIRKSIMNRF